MRNPKTGLALGCLLAHCVILFPTSAFEVLAAPAKPNVLFIAVDDLNDIPKAMGSYEDGITPNIDQLASQGVLFTQAHSQYPICGPSRASLMSGMLPTTLGFNRHPKDDAVHGKALQLGSSTIPFHFKENGYKVMAAGKLFHRHMPEGSYDLSDGRGDWGSYPEGKRNYTTRGTLTDWGVTHEEESKMSDAVASEWVVDRLEEDHNKPFLLMFGTLRPHVPWLVPQAYFDLYPEPEALTLMPYREDDFDDIPRRAREIAFNPEMPRTDWLIESGEWHRMMHSYLASTSFADYYIGEVIRALKNSPYADNTIIILWSDHGYHLGEKNTTQKHSLWQRSSHVPLIIAGPGIQPAVCERTVGLIDIFPTLASLCGLDDFKSWEGRDLTPLLQNPSLDWPYPVITTWQGLNTAVQSETHRYIRYDDGSEELYDHQTDPHEWTNQASNPEYNSIKTELARWIPMVDNTPKEKLEKFFDRRETIWNRKGFTSDGYPLP